MPTPRGGHEGALWISPTRGDALVKLTGVQDATYDPGINTAEAGGMDAPHQFDVPVKSKPSIKAKRIHDDAQDALFEALGNTEAGEWIVFAFYPFGERGDLTQGISGSAWVKPDLSQSLTDPVASAMEFIPAQPDWARFGALAAA